MEQVGFHKTLDHSQIVFSHEQEESVNFSGENQRRYVSSFNFSGITRFQEGSSCQTHSKADAGNGRSGVMFGSNLEVFVESFFALFNVREVWLLDVVQADIRGNHSVSRVDLFRSCAISGKIDFGKSAELSASSRFLLRSFRTRYDFGHPLLLSGGSSTPTRWVRMVAAYVYSVGS